MGQKARITVHGAVQARHVRDLRSCGNVLSVCSDVSADCGDLAWAAVRGRPSEADYVPMAADVPMLADGGRGTPPEMEGEAISELRRSQRTRRLPDRLHYGELGTPLVESSVSISDP